ncbi:MAG: IS30 family transposase [bacterium]
MQGLQEGWSPEQIAGRLRLEAGRRVVGPETLYRFVYESPVGRQLGLSEFLRRGKKHRTRRQGRKAHTHPIAGRRFIDQRPPQAHQRLRTGDWETDSLLFAHQQAANVLTERLSRFLVLTKLQNRSADETARVLQERLEGLPVASLTADNGPEHARHEAISRALRAPFFFCHPYASWEKGTVENTNGLIRRYLPRKTDLGSVTQQDLEGIADELNHRPRKCLGFRTPREVLLQSGGALGNRM